MLHETLRISPTFYNPLNTRTRGTRKRDKHHGEHKNIYYCPQHDLVWQYTEIKKTDGDKQLKVLAGWTRKCMPFYGAAQKLCPLCAGDKDYCLMIDSI